MIDFLLKHAFENGIQLYLTINKTLLPEDCGIPQFVLENHPENVPLTIMLSFNIPAVQGGMKMEFHKGAVELTLSFDELYRCTIPYHSVVRTLVDNPEYNPHYKPVSEILDEPVPQSGPNLRLVD